MFVEKIDLNNKKDILIADKIGQLIKSHFVLEEVLTNSTLKHFEIAKVTHDSKEKLKYTLFYNTTTKTFLVDDYRIVQVLHKYLTKTIHYLNSKYHVLMSIEMNKKLGDNSYFDSLPSNLSQEELQSFDKTLDSQVKLQKFFEKFKANNNNLEN